MPSLDSSQQSNVEVHGLEGDIEMKDNEVAQQTGNTMNDDVSVVPSTLPPPQNPENRNDDDEEDTNRIPKTKKPITK